MEQNKESEERARALTESDYVLIRMVVGDDMFIWLDVCLFDCMFAWYGYGHSFRVSVWSLQDDVCFFIV